MNMYQDQLIDHYRNPRNEGYPSWTPTHVATAKNLSCGDIVTIYLLIENEEVKEVAFEGEGCSICIGSASLLTEQVKGMTLNQLKNFSFDDLLELIGIQLTTSRMKCASIGMDALQSALHETDED